MARVPRVIAGILIAPLMTLVVVLLCLAGVSIEIPESRNVYVVIFSDQAPFYLDHGETLEVQVQVTPPDQPITFKRSETDTRVEVSVSPETGAQRTITLRDLTSPDDESPGSNPVMIRAYLPDGTEAVTEWDTPIENQITLVEALYYLIQKQVAKIRPAIDDIPNTSCNILGNLAADQAEMEAANNGQPLTAGEKVYFRDAAKYAAQPFCNLAGAAVDSDVQVQISGLPPSQVPLSEMMNKKVARPIAPAAPPDVTRQIDFNLAPIGVFTNPETGQPYSWHDYVSHPLVLTHSTFVQQPSFKLDYSVRSVDFKTTVSTNFTLKNEFGGNGIFPSAYSVQFEFHFIWPAGGP